jgi:hypothetical protein
MRRQNAHPPNQEKSPSAKSTPRQDFFAKLFGPKAEDEKKDTPVAATTTPAATPPSATPAGQVPYTHTMNPAAYNQRMGYYPNMAASPGGRAMYPSYYSYPVQNMPQQRQQQAQPQQFLYYPNLDQSPQ